MCSAYLCTPIRGQNDAFAHRGAWEVLGLLSPGAFAVGPVLHFSCRSRGSKHAVATGLAAIGLGVIHSVFWNGRR